MASVRAAAFLANFKSAGQLHPACDFLFAPRPHCEHTPRSAAPRTANFGPDAPPVLCRVTLGEMAPGGGGVCRGGSSAKRKQVQKQQA